MADNVSNELILEVLKKIQDTGTNTYKRIVELEEQVKGIRHLLISMQSDDLRHEAAIAAVRADVDQIKNRLELSDA